MIRFIKTLLSKKTNPSSKAESAPTDEAATDNAGPTPDEQPADADVSMPSEPTKPAIPAAIEVELQRRFNEFDCRFNERQREVLDDRAKSISRWLSVISIVLTFFGVVAVVGGYLGFTKFEKIEDEARQHVTAAKQHATESKKYAEEAHNFREKTKANYSESELVLADQKKRYALRTQTKPTGLRKVFKRIPQHP